MASIASLQPNWSIAVNYSKENLAHLLTELSSKGLHALTRPGHDSSTIYVFVRDCSDAVPRITKGLPYVQNVVALRDKSKCLEAEGISTKVMVTRLLPSQEDIIKLGHVTGSPANAMYFAYAKNYTRWLMVLSVVGLGFRLFSNQAPWEFNLSYAIVALLWSIAFVSSWVGKTERVYAKSLHFTESSSLVPAFPRTVFIKKLCFIPVALQFVACLVCFQFLCFVLEIFITQIYRGPLASILALVPTVLICAYVPILTIFYDKVINKLISWENSGNPLQSKLEKKFVFTFLTSYVPLLITLFVYLPLGHHLNSQLTYIADVCSYYRIPVIQTSFKIDIKRYQNQFFYFIVTNQVIALCVENILPIVLGKALPLIKGENKETSALKQAEQKMAKDYPEDMDIWKQVRAYNLSPWGAFDSQTMFSKMIVQFGYVAMFSTIWPLAPLCCVVFNIIGIKCDAWRCLNKCTPTRIPSDTVDKSLQSTRSASTEPPNKMAPWDTILKFVLWASSLVSPALVIMYNKSNFDGSGLVKNLEKRDHWYLNSPVDYDWKYIVVFAFIGEHVAVFLYYIVSKIFGQSSTGNDSTYVPAKRLEEPPHVDLKQVVEETEQFMEKSGVKSTVASKGIGATSSNPRGQAEHVTITEPAGSVKESVLTNRASPSKAANMAPKTEMVSRTHSDSSSKDENVSNLAPQPMQLNNSIMSLTSSVAGATVPDTIPTSKNYHLRYDQNGDAISPNSQSAIEVDASKPSELKSDDASSEEATSKKVGSGLKEERTAADSTDATHIKKNVPEVITTGIGKQFVPDSILDASKTHLASITNPHEAEVVTPAKQKVKSNPTTPSSNDEEAIISHGYASNAQSESDHHASGQSHHTTASSRKSHDETKTAKKKKKSVLSPLSKLKKKFP